MPRYPYSVPDVASIGRLLGDESRAAMLIALMDGRAWTVGELAAQLEIAKSTATAHAHQLVDGGLCVEARQGRHRYLRLADTDVAEAVEALGMLSGRTLSPPRTLAAGTKDEALRAGRTCYGHLAGRLGVDLLTSLRRIEVVTTNGELGPNGAEWFTALGVSPGPSRRPALRACLDWTERRDHLAGSYADALCRRLLDASWLERSRNTRAVRLTEAGRAALAQRGVTLSV
ncbi:ArsR/SmtB family transcription factor [Microbacterium algeriense]|uniref:ArsR/SmtB family transcription factor n=1 Tax=Microbacterium algeriense TaxID=2615184 RepID=UPI0022E956C1|nr:winged helix-turn-helix domain-containing protein [Microbacterium algeriense]